MDSYTGALGNRWRNRKDGLFAKIIAAILSLMLLLLSLMLVNINVHAANIDNAPPALSKKQSPTPTLTSTAIPSPTTSPTATHTPSPTVIPTKTPTATPTPKVTATATSTKGVTPTATSKPSPAATTTPNSSGNQTPSPISGVPTTTNNGGNSNGGRNGNGTPPALSQGSPFGLSLSSFILGSLIFLSIVGAMLFGLVMLRKRLLPNQTPQVNLPPSGARPWKRIRTGSLEGITNVPGFYPQNNNGFPSSPPDTPPTTSFYPANGLSSSKGFMLASNATSEGARPVTWETKPLTRHVPSSIRLQAMENSGLQSAESGLELKKRGTNNP